MTARNFDRHLLPHEAGLYCPPGDFYIDPVRPVARALITHGHADHARAGHGSVIATPETLAIMRLRYGKDFARKTQSLDYGESLPIKDAQVRLVPAGHVLGSAQAVIAAGGCRFVVSGDYKRRFDPTCAGFEPVPCDVFITEATFALPVFRHPDSAGEAAKLLRAREMFPDRAILVGAYALGKAQRLISLLRRTGYDRTIYLHGALEKMCSLYEEFGIELGRLRPVAGMDKAELKGEIVMAPPSALADRWSRRLPDPLPAFASGWMRVRARARQRGVELPLIISDHADWDELTQTIDEVRPNELWVTHGREEALIHYAEQQGIAARPLALVGYDEEGGGHDLETVEGMPS